MMPGAASATLAMTCVQINRWFGGGLIQNRSITRTAKSSRRFGIRAGDDERRRGGAPRVVGRAACRVLAEEERGRGEIRRRAAPSPRGEHGQELVEEQRALLRAAPAAAGVDEYVARRRRRDEDLAVAERAVRVLERMRRTRGGDRAAHGVGDGGFFAFRAVGADGDDEEEAWPHVFLVSTPRRRREAIGSRLRAAAAAGR